MKKSNNLEELLKGLEVRVIGNRATFLGTTLLTLGAAGIYGLFSAEQINESIKAVGGLSLLSGIFGGVYILGLTDGGKITSKFYQLTRRHINKHGSLNPEFVSSILGHTENKVFTGYCQMQGVYLAARDAQQTDAFRKGIEGKSNIIIPHI